MKRPSLRREIGIAVALSLAGAVGFRALALFVGASSALRLTVLTVGTIYVIALLSAAPMRAGRLVVAIVTVGLGAGLIALDPPLPAWVLALTAGFWLLRCGYLHDGLGAAVKDAALSTFSIAAASYGAMHSRSLFLALWAYFLVQALWTLIPAAAAATTASPDDGGASRFDQAERTAEAALRRLTLRH
ncbi:MAG TPA: hypothetical protein VLF18_08350 [Tahibacter sp.]|uniref:hypothetical protein n=1 Tax=Tahibacter sp. TaxID=2056211 RepID=UPI002C099FC1|nr:hypothetical protein [Tahibacter sp.]HSX60194.1 hypothetical protein [Tahibacter sp.]